MTKPTIWITRTQPAADVSAKAWADAGLTPVVLPLLAVTPVPNVTPPPDGSTLIFTSKNGVDHFSGCDFPIICVGDATAAHARAAGFTDVVSVDGTSADVTKWVKQNLPKTTQLTHVSGRHIRGTITEDLVAAGYNAARIIVYRSQKIFPTPPSQIDYVALYSPLAAEGFAQISDDWDCRDVTVLSISAATDAQLGGRFTGRRYFAARPNEGAMLALLNPASTR